jgi:DnaJ-class molecular chaperone
MKRVLSSEGRTCSTCRGRGIHGSILRGSYAEPLVCVACHGYGRIRKDANGEHFKMGKEILTLEEVKANPIPTYE